MASSTAKPPAPNLATLVAIKGKMTTKTQNQPELSQPPAMTGSRSDEKTTYHQNWSVQDPQEKTTTAPPTNTTDQPKISRKTKQLEVTLLDKKMEEINLKQEAKKNEALDTWKGFDSVNYGFIPESGRPKSTAVSPVTKKQRTPTSSPPPKQQPSPVKTGTEPSREKSPIQPQSAKKHRSPTPRRVDSPIKDQPRAKSPPRKDEKHRSPTPRRVTSPIKDQPRSKSPPREDEKHRSPAPRRVDSPIKDQPRSKSPSREDEKPRKETPPPRQKAVQNQPIPPPSPKHEKIDKKRSPSPPQHQEKSIEKQSSSPTSEQTSTETHPSPPPRRKSVEKQPSPPPRRRSKVILAPSVEKAKSPEQEVKSQSPTAIIENIIPFPSTTIHPELFGKHVPSFEQSSLPISTTPHFKLFPDIKNSEMKRFRNANKSIQRSMDRYRFHIW